MNCFVRKSARSNQKLAYFGFAVFELLEMASVGIILLKRSLNSFYTYAKLLTMSGYLPAHCLEMRPFDIHHAGIVLWFWVAAFVISIVVSIGPTILCSALYGPFRVDHIIRIYLFSTFASEI